MHVHHPLSSSHRPIQLTPSLQTLDRFILAADHRWFLKRKYRLCLVRNHETTPYEPQHVELREPNSPLFVHDSDLECSPGASEDVSIELDELCANDAETCLLRVNGRENLNEYGEVRCYWESALFLSLALAKGKTNIRTLQCVAAFNGGVLPDRGGGKDQVMNNRVPERLTQRAMPLGEKRTSSGPRSCPVFLAHRVSYKVVNRFMDEVNLPLNDPRHRQRVSVVNVDRQNGTAFQLIEKTPIAKHQLHDCFVGLSFGTLCDFVRSHCSAGDINSKYFITMDKLTAKRLPGMCSKAFEQRSTRWLNCVIGDTFCEEAGGPLALRCTFDSCADIIDSLVAGTSLKKYVNDAAVERRGCYSYPVSHDGAILFPQPAVGLSVFKEADEVYSKDVTALLPRMQREIEELHLTGSPEDWPELTQPDVGWHLPSPMKHVLRSKLQQWLLEENQKSGLPPSSSAPATGAVKRHRDEISPCPGNDCSTPNSRRHSPDVTQPQVACGAEAVTWTKHTPHSSRFYDSGIGSSSGVGSSRRSPGATAGSSSRVDSESPSKMRKVDSMIYHVMSDIEDDENDDENDHLYDILLSERIL